MSFQMFMHFVILQNTKEDLDKKTKKKQTAFVESPNQHQALFKMYIFQNIWFQKSY